MYAMRITEPNSDLLRFLNDGYPVIPRPDETHYLVVEINGPREITTKRLSESELEDQYPHIPLLVVE